MLNADAVLATLPNIPPISVAVVEADVTAVPAEVEAPANVTVENAPTSPINPPTSDVPVIVPVAKAKVSLNVIVYPVEPKM